MTQAAGETASKTVKVSFPSGFSVNSPAVATCTAAQEAARSCPADSRVGDAAATASVVLVPVELTGNVFYGGVTTGGKVKLIVFLDNDQLNQHVTVEGLIGIRPEDAGFDAIFDNLPDQLTTTFKLHLLGAEKALSKNPLTCGEYTFNASFTSQKGETATSRPRSRSGLPPPRFVLSPLDLEPSRRAPAAGPR